MSSISRLSWVSFQQTKSTLPTWEADSHDDFWDEIQNTLAKDPSQFETDLTYSDSLLNDYKRLLPCGVQYLSEKERALILEKLSFIALQYQARLWFDYTQRRYARLEDSQEKIELCESLINKIPSSSTPRVPTPDPGQFYYTRYLGLKLVVPILIKCDEQLLAGGKTNTTNLISFLNERRLYWVWAGASVSTILTLFPNCFNHAANATSMMSHIGIVTGSMSFIFYFMRGGFEVYSLLRHSFTILMDEKEREWHRKAGSTLKQRLDAEWEKRKYVILNDLIWGVCNCLCFFVLFGTGWFAYSGNVFTVVLLAMDIYLSCKKWKEQEAAFFKERDAILLEIQELETQIRKVKSRFISKDEMLTLEEAYRNAKFKLKLCEANWQYKSRMMGLDIIYATLLMASFLAVMLFFFPPTLAPVGLLMLSVVGVFLCFGFNALYTTASFQIGRMHAQKMSDTINHHLIEELHVFKINLENFTSATGADQNLLNNQLRLHYLKLRDLSYSSEQQQKVLTQQTLRMIVGTIRDFVFPAIFIVSFTLMPFTAGISVCAASIILFFLIHKYLVKESEKQNMPEVFPEEDYQEFLTQVRQTSPYNIGEQLLPFLYQQQLLPEEQNEEQISLINRTI